jgi:hypothetical protein
MVFWVVTAYRLDRIYQMKRGHNLHVRLGENLRCHKEALKYLI